MSKMLHFPRRQICQRDWQDMPEYSDLADHELRQTRKPAPCMFAPLIAIGMAAAMLPWLPLAYIVHISRPE